MSDLNAIREDIAMAARSAEMCRHVALDHASELVDEVETLRTELADAKKCWLAMDDAWIDLLRKVSDATGLVDPERDLSEDEVVAAVASLAPRRVETAEELDALPVDTVIRAERLVPGRRRTVPAYFERRGKEWTEMEPSDRSDGEETFRSSDVRAQFDGTITVLWTPEGER